jgi:hypothetical protein
VREIASGGRASRRKNKKAVQKQNKTKNSIKPAKNHAFWRVCPYKVRLNLRRRRKFTFGRLFMPN